jgi:NAD(P)-dependent dehydrogenase (short-subunit alcohol dehydrogenase family)
MTGYDKRVVLITGAANGIGLETARAAYRRGASVALVDRDAQAVARAASALENRALGLTADVTDRVELRRAIDAAAERFGRLDVVVANAGVAPKVTTIGGTTDEEFDRVIGVNVGGVWNTARGALPHLRDSHGQLVIVASVYAFLNGALGATYAASKAAVESLGRTLRVELAPEGIGVTVAYFGFVDTDLVRGSFDGDPLADRFEAMFPTFLSKRITPQTAAEAIIAGVERGAARVVEPSPWRVLFGLRGVAGAVGDRLLARDRRLHAIIADARRRETARNHRDPAPGIDKHLPGADMVGSTRRLLP